MTKYILFEINNKIDFGNLLYFIEIFNRHISSDDDAPIEALKSELGYEFVKNFSTYTKKE